MFLHNIVGITSVNLVYDATVFFQISICTHTFKHKKVLSSILSIKYVWEQNKNGIKQNKLKITSKLIPKLGNWTRRKISEAVGLLIHT